MKTNKAQHTPGPWKAYGVPVSLETGNHWLILAASPHVPGKTQTVCELNGPWKPENYSANAKLIALAPDMAGLLKDSLQLAKLTGPNLEVFARTFAALAETLLNKL